MRFILHSPARGVSSIVSRARRAEELGYEGLFVADSQMNNLDPFVALAAAALATKRLALGTAVTNMVYRDPTVLAGSAASLNEIADGRAVLGLGSGDGPVYSLGRKATPVSRFEAGLRTIRSLLAGESVELGGHRVRLRAGRLGVPVYVSAEGPRMLRLAGKLADGILLGTGFDLRVLEWARERAAEGAAEAERDPDGIELIAAGMICVDPDGGRARELVRPRLANRAHHNFRFTLETVPAEELEGVKRFLAAFDIRKPIEERVDPALVTDYLLERFAIAGTPRECAARLEALARAGIRRVLVTPPNTIYDETMERWASEVMSRLPAGE